MIFNPFKAHRKHVIERHRRELLERMSHTANDTLAAMITIETDPQTMAMLVAALQERHAFTLTMVHVDNVRTQYTQSGAFDPGPGTATFNPFDDDIEEQ